MCHAPRSAGDGRERVVPRDRARQPFLGSAPETGRVVLAEHDPDREPVPKRNAPAPARSPAVDEYLPRRFGPAESLEVGEVGDVLAGADSRRNVEQASDVASAARGVDDEIGLATSERRRRRQGLGREHELGAGSISASALQVRPGRHVAHAGGDGFYEQRLVESRPRNVVGVRKDRGGEPIERHADLIRGRPDERRAGLAAAEARDLLLDPEAAQDRDDGRNERLPDQ